VDRPPEIGGMMMATGRRTNRLLTTAMSGLLASVSLLVAIGTGGTATASPRPSVLTSSPSSLDLGAPPLGTFNGPDTFSVTNTGSSTDSIDVTGSDLSFSGAGANDYLVVPEASCPGNGTTTVVLTPSSSCTMDVYFYPGALGSRPATITVKGSADTTGTSVQVSGSGAIGYYQVDRFGDVARAGDAPFYGDAGSLQLNRPIVAITPTGNNGGYWLVASDGGIFSYGDAGFYGSTGSFALNKPIVGMSRTADGHGYWMVASDGGIFAFGDAGFHGSAGNIPLNKPIVGMAATVDGNGYWLVASDGGIFSYGDAGFYGSAGNIPLNKPIVGMAATPDGRGYWLVASDGGVFAYGDAPFYGSAGNIELSQPIVSMAAMPDGGGYWFSAVDGGLFNYGTAPFYGSGVGLGLGPIVDMATNGGPTVQAANDFPAVRHADLAQLRRTGGLELPRMAQRGT
jgi:hypothetical protein